MNLYYQYTNTLNTIHITEEDEDDEEDEEEENDFDGTTEKKFEVGSLIIMKSLAFQLHY